MGSRRAHLICRAVRASAGLGACVFLYVVDCQSLDNNFAQQPAWKKAPIHVRLATLPTKYNIQNKQIQKENMAFFCTLLPIYIDYCPPLAAGAPGLCV